MVFLQLLESGGGGINRPSDDQDFAYILHQVYHYMSTHYISFTFNGHYFEFTFWALFLAVIAFDIIIWAVQNFYLGDMTYKQ